MRMMTRSNQTLTPDAPTGVHFANDPSFWRELFFNSTMDINPAKLLLLGDQSENSTARMLGACNYMRFFAFYFN